MSARDASTGWLPWALISVVMIAWSYFKLFPRGQLLRSTFWHSVLFAALIGALAFVQAYLATWMIP